MRAKTKHALSLIKRYAKYIVLTSNIIAILVLFCAYLSWYVSPVHTRLFAYLGLGFPFIVVINIMYVIFWFITLNWKLGLIGLSSLLLCIIPIYSYYPINLRSKDVPVDCFKVLTYNVKGFSHEWRGNALDNKVIMYINENQADIVCLQEFVFYGNSNEIIDGKFKKSFPNYPHFAIINLKPNLKGVVYGIVCLSKYPISSSMKIPIKAESNGAGLFRLDINGRPVTLISTHLQSNRLTTEDKKMYKEFIKDRSTEAFDSVTYNLKSRLGVAYKERAVQVDMITNLLANEQAESVIICGDFNDTPTSYTYNNMKGNLGDSFRETGFGPGITYNENYFWFRIDYIMHSKNITAYNCTVDKVLYSDHYPVWTYLRFNDKDRVK